MSDCSKENPCKWPGCEQCGPRLSGLGRDVLCMIITTLIASCREMEAQLEGPPMPMRRASVVLVQNYAGDYLVVWNRRFGGWTLPGGKQEPGESDQETAARELDEETGFLYSPEAFEKVWEGVNRVQGSDDMYVVVFQVKDRLNEAIDGPCEPGCPIGWLSGEDILRWSPFAEFYRRGRLFDPPKAPTEARASVEKRGII